MEKLYITHKNLLGGSLQGTQADDAIAPQECQATDIRSCERVIMTQQTAGQIQDNLITNIIKDSSGL